NAFTKLLQNNAEQAQWRQAADTAASEYGKPAVERSCPFYKKLYGGILTVDAFRYSKVDGCKAYFLSHFHSDHYTGLSSTWTHGPIYCSRATANLVKLRLRVKPEFVKVLPWDKDYLIPDGAGIKVRLIDANHCPGSGIFLFTNPRGLTILHCGDFRANKTMLRSLANTRIDELYLDTTYLTPKYAFPRQSAVISACASLVSSLANPTPSLLKTLQSYLPPPNPNPSPSNPPGRLLVVIGTYSIGKERICLGIASALHTKIFAAPAKMATAKALEDPHLNSFLTPIPEDAQVHMTTLKDITVDSLKSYLSTLSTGGFTRIVGIKPTGWSYRPPGNRGLDKPSVRSILDDEAWESPFGVADLKPRGVGTGARDGDVAVYMVPYSEHSSFRELTRFVCGLEVGRVVPTVNVGTERGRERMRGWMGRWEEEKRKRG
ncbi:DRMBL-domain-containing protein, partial [Ascobolus immersus RN42]